MTEKKRGRPTRGGESTTLSLRLPVETLQQYREIARMETERVGVPITVTAVMVRALGEDLKRRGVM